MIIEAVQDTFESEIAKAEKPVVAYFWATWCQSCKAMAPMIESISKDNEDRFQVVKVNIGDSPELAEKYGVMSTPTIIVFKEGQKPKTAQTGYAAKAWLVEVLEKYV